jgi:NDP-sugar pyrophosphorylase family protein
MQNTLICPGERPALAFLSQTVPLVAVPILGENLLAYWLEWLAGSGAKEVCLLVTDRPELVRSLLGDGSRWGLRIQVQPELTELTLADFRTRQIQERNRPSEDSNDAIVIDHLPGLESVPLFQSYRQWFNALLTWMPRTASLQRIGLRELQPRVWCGSRTHLGPGAKVHAPCWIGNHVRIGPEAVIGPEVILEDRVVIDAAAELRASVVGPDTFVGGLTRIESSIAWGNVLIDWRTGSCTHVPDSFLLCALGQRYLPEPPRRRHGWRGQTFLELIKRPLGTDGPSSIQS